MKLSEFRFIDWPPLDELDRKLFTNFSAYREIITKGNQTIVSLNEVLEKNLREIRDSSDPDDEATWHYEAEYYHFEAPIIESYRNIYWRSLLVSQIAHLESTLKFLCTLINKELNPPAPISYPNREIVQSYYREITKLYSISSRKLDSTWPKIDLAVKVRNLVTHGDFSRLPLIENQLIKISSIKIVTEEDTSKQLEFLDGEYSKSLIKTIQIFCDELVDAVDREYKRQCIEKGVQYF